MLLIIIIPSLSVTSTVVVLGERITFEGGSDADGSNLSSNMKLSPSSNIGSSMIVTLNDC